MLLWSIFFSLSKSIVLERIGFVSDGDNSILQPAVATAAPVVGVAITAEVAVPGCGMGASHLVDIEVAGRFCIEAAREFGKNKCRFYDEEEYSRIVKLYGEMTRFQTYGNGADR